MERASEAGVLATRQRDVAKSLDNGALSRRLIADVDKFWLQRQCSLNDQSLKLLNGFNQVTALGANVVHGIDTMRRIIALTIVGEVTALRSMAPIS